MEPSPGSQLQIDVAWDGVVAAVTVSGELGLTTAPRLAGQLLEVAQARPERLVLDLNGLLFLDVAGVRILDDMHKALEAGCPVIVRNPHPSARRVFRRTGLVED